MSTNDAAFAGSIPAIYDRYLGPLLFAPYARDMAERAANFFAEDVLETAAGTGLLTVELARSLLGARIVTTDLNPAMLEVAKGREELSGFRFEVANAQDLPFDDQSQDLVACQFGMMFLPDRAAGYREAARVLRPGGTFLFNMWNSLDENPVSRIVAESVADLFPDDPPRFLQRVPFAHHDLDIIRADLRAAGFVEIAAHTVQAFGHAESAEAAAYGLCQGTPLRGEIEARGGLDQATSVATEALRAVYGDGPVDAPMSAHVIAATR